MTRLIEQLQLAQHAVKKAIGSRLLQHLVFAAAFSLASSQGQAFEIAGNKWPGATTDFYVAMSGASQTGVLWNTAFIAAMQEWNTRTDFKFVLRNEYRNPCANDQFNSVDFTSTVCGSEYGRGTIAVALRSYRSEILGPASLARTDIVVNSAIAFDIFDGDLRQPGISFNGIDFRRVALHELGHALGLDHSNQTAMMLPNIGNTFRLQTDDITGTNTLYGGLSVCPIQTVSFGKYTDALQAGDCTVQKLTVGGTDNSLIDVRRLQLDSPTFVRIRMQSPSLDSVIVLADAALRFLAVNDNGAGKCDALIEQTLPAGTYYVISNTWTQATNCGATTGPYNLSISFISPSTSSLGRVESLSGGTANASFSGGITANNGNSYGNLFKPSDSLDIIARIRIDPLHRSRSGFLVVAAQIDGTLLLKNAQGQFVDYPGLHVPLIKAASKILDAQEDVAIATDLVPAAINVQNTNVNFLVGYGLDSNPQELFYHQTPINLLVEP